MNPETRKKIESELDPGGFTSVQAALGFCALGLLAILFLLPSLDDGADRIADMAATGGIDSTVTGSVQGEEPVKRYTIRQSVLQSDPSVPCIIYEDGTKDGGC